MHNAVELMLIHTSFLVIHVASGVARTSLQSFKETAH